MSLRADPLGGPAAPYGVRLIRISAVFYAEYVQRYYSIERDIEIWKKAIQQTQGSFLKISVSKAVLEFQSLFHLANRLAAL